LVGIEEKIQSLCWYSATHKAWVRHETFPDFNPWKIISVYVLKKSNDRVHDLSTKLVF
jgi:hypothetical protein